MCSSSILIILIFSNDEEVRLHKLRGTLEVTSHIQGD